MKKIYDIISSVVGNKNFGVDDDILMTGLNSISMVRLNVLLGKEFDVPLKYMPMADVIYAMNKIGAGIRIEKTLSALMKLEYFDGTFEKRNK